MTVPQFCMAPPHRTMSLGVKPLLQKPLLENLLFTQAMSFLGQTALIIVVHMGISVVVLLKIGRLFESKSLALTLGRLELGPRGRQSFILITRDRAVLSKPPFKWRATSTQALQPNVLKRSIIVRSVVTRPSSSTIIVFF